MDDAPRTDFPRGSAGCVEIRSTSAVSLHQVSNAAPHGFRASGRAYAANGKLRKAIKYFDKATAAAEEIGAQYEQARALIDKSMLEHPYAQTDRARGVKMLESLGCVLPVAEVEYLGIDRESHHARATAAYESAVASREPSRNVGEGDDS